MQTAQEAASIVRKFHADLQSGKDQQGVLHARSTSPELDEIRTLMVRDTAGGGMNASLAIVANIANLLAAGERVQDVQMSVANALQSDKATYLEVSVAHGLTVDHRIDLADGIWLCPNSEIDDP